VEGKMLKKEKICSALIIAVMLVSFTQIGEIHSAKASSYEFFDGFENGFSQWDGIVKGFPEDPLINSTIVHNGSSSMYCYSNHGLYKEIPLSNVIDVQFYWNLEYADDADCQLTHTVDVRNTMTYNVFAAVYFECESDWEHVTLELKYLDADEINYVYCSGNGTIAFEAWQPTTWHSIRLKVCLESNETANDGSYSVWLDGENVATVTNVDTMDSVANQVQLGQQSTFFFYAFYDDATIKADNTEIPESSVLSILILGISTTATFLALKKKRKILNH
jgi:hypothetical protein